jgi:predicted 3-demethylubiquinone-9 3-methyltransferase (glyoxalase superfamily)
MLLFSNDCKGFDVDHHAFYFAKLINPFRSSWMKNKSGVSGSVLPRSLQQVMAICNGCLERKGFLKSAI